ncbi:rep protein, partial [Klebsiella pneumoniae]|nr:rep protein [Klebsiella pneumoniae]
PPAIRASCAARGRGDVYTRQVGGRRPSVLQRWGSGVLPRRFPVALKALPEPWRLGFYCSTG